MKRLFLCAALAAVMMLSGCSAMKIERGLDASGSFVSSASPSVTVQTSADFSAVASGRTLCVVPIENGFIPSQSTEVWYSLHKAENAQIAVMLAECIPVCTWNVSPTGVEYEYKPLLYKFYGEGTRDANVLVYTRKVEKDPWMPVFAQAGSSWEGETLVARYEWVSIGSTEKLVAEYREPAKVLGEDAIYPVSDLNDFIARSQKAFSLSGVQGGVQVAPAPRTNVPNHLLAPVVGSVTIPEPEDYDND